MLFLSHHGRGDTGALQYILFSKYRRISCHRRAFRLRQIDAPLPPLRPPASGFRRNPHRRPSGTILANASLGLEIRKKNDEAHQKRLKEMMADYGLAHFMNARPSELSGGMRQRAALIRTLALEPDILLLDEPFSALDYQTRLSVCDDISAIIRKQHKTAVLITHDLSEAVSVADRIMILSDRPARIKAILKTPFPDPDMTPLKRRNDPAFSSCFNEVWTILQNKSTEVSHGIT